MQNFRIYNADLGLDGTLDELIEWAYCYDSDYSDDALLEITRQGEMYGHPRSQIPMLVMKGRKREQQ